MTIGRGFQRWRRLLRGAFRWIVRLPRSLNLIEWAMYAFAFPQHDWAKRLRRSLATEETQVGWQQAINPLYWIVWGCRFAVRWIVTRPYRTLTPSIPAVLALAMILATVLASARRDRVQTQTVYLDVLRTSLADGDTEAASVAAQRLLAIDPNNLEHQYQLAMLDEELGKTAAAREAIVRLAIEKEYGPAALWMLRALVYERNDDDAGESGLVKRSEWSDEERALCHRCGTVAMTKLPSERAMLAKKMYAEFLAENGYASDALRLYESISAVDPSVNLAAAQLANRIAQRNGDYLEVQRYAKAAVRHLRPQLDANPTSVQTRLQYAQALVLDERDQEAYRLLIEGWESTRHPLMKMAAGEARVFTAERMKRSVGVRESLAERGPLLYQALELAPTSPVVLEAVVQFSIECSEVEDRELRAVRKKLLAGVEPAAMHFIEGTVALMNGDHEPAEHHLSLAAGDWVNMGGLLNNLAYALLSKNDEELLPKALDLSNAALTQIPDYPALLETRGQILLKMERYREAIADLEKALADPNMRPTAHRGLAEAYTQLGLAELAEENRRQAARYANP
jgi:tetratricopeptide (TPR) repeat protein